MGATLTKIPNNTNNREIENQNMVDYGVNNGLFLNDHYLPPEVVVLILSYVDVRSLYKNCIYVCKVWNQLIKEDVWKIKAERKYRKKLNKYPLQMYQMICVKNPFDRNLILNSSGEKSFKHWEILSNGGDKFIVENPPQGCDPVPDELQKIGIKSCFATSYYSCSKAQTVDLIKAGLTAEFLDKFQPPIYVSEWFGSRFDCGCVYEISVILCDSQRKQMKNGIFQRRESVEQWQGGSWNKVEHVFRNYGPGVRFIYFQHYGQDTQFWAGHYGSKIAGATIKILHPE